MEIIYKWKKKIKNLNPPNKKTFYKYENNNNIKK